MGSLKTRDGKSLRARFWLPLIYTFFVFLRFIKRKVTNISNLTPCQASTPIHQMEVVPQVEVHPGVAWPSPTSTRSQLLSRPTWIPNTSPSYPEQSVTHSNWIRLRRATCQGKHTDILMCELQVIKECVASPTKTLSHPNAVDYYTTGGLSSRS